ncbi:MAG: hypothetical protein Tsb0013_21120 [Phycisphaerales bacterium]
MPPADLTEKSISELKSEIKRRERQLASLHRKREKLVGQLQEIDDQIAGLGGTASGASPIGGGRKRYRNDSNLADALADLLKDQTLSVTAASIEVQKAGYKTTSPNFRTIVNQTLLRDKRFKRVGRGLYTSGKVSGSANKAGSKKRTTKRNSRRSKKA